MKKSILIPSLILGMLLTGSLALAGPGGCGSCDRGDSCRGKGQGQGQGVMNPEQREARSGKRLLMMTTVLDLTETQQSQIDALMNEQREEHQQLREKMRDSRDDLRGIRMADTFNETEFLAKAVKQAELKTQMMVEKAKLKQQIYAFLTPDQQEKADKLAKMKRGKGRHGGFGF